MVVERADKPSRARCDVRSNVRARFLNALFGGALFGLVDTHITMASAAMRFAAATGRGNFSAPGNNPARDRAPVAQAALGGRRNALRAALRARSAAPTRFARGGVMPVNAKHTAVPEARVRRLTRKIAAPSFLCNNRPRPRFASAREGATARAPHSRAHARRRGIAPPPNAARENPPPRTRLTELNPPPSRAPRPPSASSVSLVRNNRKLANRRRISLSIDRENSFLLSLKKTAGSFRSRERPRRVRRRVRGRAEQGAHARERRAGAGDARAHDAPRRVRVRENTGDGAASCRPSRTAFRRRRARDRFAREIGESASACSTCPRATIRGPRRVRARRRGGLRGDADGRPGLARRAHGRRRRRPGRFRFATEPEVAQLFVKPTAIGG